MHTNGHTTVWGTHIGIGRARGTKSWYEHLKEWWTAHKAARRDAKLSAMNARWDAKREALKPLHAEACADIVAREHTYSTIAAFSALSV